MFHFLTCELHQSLRSNGALKPKRYEKENLTSSRNRHIKSTKEGFTWIWIVLCKETLNCRSACVIREANDVKWKQLMRAQALHPWQRGRRRGLSIPICVRLAKRDDTNLGEKKWFYYFA